MLKPWRSVAKKMGAIASDGSRWPPLTQYTTGTKGDDVLAAFASHSGIECDCIFCV